MCINNWHLLKGFANDCIRMRVVCSELIIFEYTQDMCNDIQFISKLSIAIYKNTKLKSNKYKSS
jgi:hypothetical protein